MRKMIIIHAAAAFVQFCKAFNPAYKVEKLKLTLNITQHIIQIRLRHDSGTEGIPTGFHLHLVRYVSQVWAKPEPLQLQQLIRCSKAVQPVKPNMAIGTHARCDIGVNAF